jgi:hypothetical protein
MAWRARVLLVAVLLVVACGEGDDAEGQGAVVDPEHSEAADTAGEPVDAAPTESDDAPVDDDAPASDLDDEVQELLDDLDFGDGGARVSLGDQTYEFTLGGNSPEIDGKTYLGVCQTLFGAIAGTGYEIQGDRVVTIEFDLPPADWESYEDGRFDTVTPRMKIEDVATEETWVADMMLADGFPEVAGASQIDDWVTDDTTASGTATFTAIHPYGSPVEGGEPLQGSFELGCADD